MKTDVTMDPYIWAVLRTTSSTSLTPRDLTDILCNLSLEFAHPLPRKKLLRRVEKIYQYREQLKKLQLQPYIAQRSPEWYELRKQRLTASDTAQALGVGKFGSKNQLIQKKAKEVFPHLAIPFKTMPAMKWGIMFEPMALRCYCRVRGNMVTHEFGLIPHPDVPFYGASPDSITEMGIMVEIKCPFKRKITGEVPDYYELQMQGQMAVCGLQECDYVECDMQTFDGFDDFQLMCDGEQGNEDFGIICEKNDEYEYSPEAYTPEQCLEWASQETFETHRKVYWKLRHMNVQRVYFDDTRWQSLLPPLEEFWNRVLQMREELAKGPVVEEEEHSPKKKKTDLQKYQFIEDDL